MIWKLLGPALAGIALGFFLGGKFERAGWVEQLEDQRAKAEERLEQAEEQADRDRAVLEENYRATIADYQRELQEAQADAQRTREIAEQERRRAESLAGEIDEIQERWSGRSVCELDPADVGLLNAAVEAANRAAEGLSGDPGPDAGPPPDP